MVCITIFHTSRHSKSCLEALRSCAGPPDTSLHPKSCLEALRCRAGPPDTSRHPKSCLQARRSCAGPPDTSRHHIVPRGPQELRRTSRHLQALLSDPHVFQECSKETTRALLSQRAPFTVLFERMIKAQSFIAQRECSLTSWCSTRMIREMEHGKVGEAREREVSKDSISWMDFCSFIDHVTNHQSILIQSAARTLLQFKVQ